MSNNISTIYGHIVIFIGLFNVEKSVNFFYNEKYLHDSNDTSI